MEDIGLTLFIIFAAICFFGEIAIVVIGIMLAIIAAILGAFAAGGAIVGFLTLYLVRDLLLRLLPKQMSRGAIQSLRRFWAVVPVITTPVLAAVLASRLQHDQGGWQFLVAANVVGYLYVYYHQLTTTSPQCAQWMQFIAERDQQRAEQKLADQRWSTDLRIQQEIRQYFSAHKSFSSPLSRGSKAVKRLLQ